MTTAAGNRRRSAPPGDQRTDADGQHPVALRKTSDGVLAAKVTTVEPAERGRVTGQAESTCTERKRERYDDEVFRRDAQHEWIADVVDHLTARPGPTRSGATCITVGSSRPRRVRGFATR